MDFGLRYQNYLQEMKALATKVNGARLDSRKRERCRERLVDLTRRLIPSVHEKLEELEGAKSQRKALATARKGDSNVPEESARERRIRLIAQAMDRQDLPMQALAELWELLPHTDAAALDWWREKHRIT